jgi:cell fate regulator YaaT (PSP1 superfamily)|tara:strand:- start:415 stop:612 length:198 start_codon:yes stop_codon:yes gene_type:complete
MAKIRSKKIIAVQKEYDWYKKKVGEMEKERGYDRSWDGKQILVKFKKIKLFLKTQLDNMKKSISG